VQIFKPSNVEVVFKYSVLTISLGSNLIAIDSDFVGSDLLAIYSVYILSSSLSKKMQESQQRTAFSLRRHLLNWIA
jgi:hypothetical protein